MTALHLRGIVLPDDIERDIWIKNGALTFTPVPGAETIATSGYILPGLVDAHCHIGIDTGSVPVESLDRARELARIDRDAGVLTIRDAGSPVPYPQLEDESDLPRLIRAGQHLAPPKRYLRGIATEQGSAEVAAEAARQAQLGNGWIKLVGDWIDRDYGDLAPTYDNDVFADVVAAAHRHGARVAAHTFSEDALPGLLAAGIDSIEHGTGLSMELIDTAARLGTALIPTLTNVENFPGYAAQGEKKFPRYAAHMRRLHQNFPRVVAAAYEAGVPIYVGTDAGGHVRHGLAAEEIQRLHEVGMSKVDALAAGSWRARTWLGLSGIDEGGLADLVVYAEDPRVDLRVLTAPQRIVLRGAVVR
ncbi:MAG: amidohydrolase family protein [Corynebacteriales bacterium]|nr:amidohydrolase family protein [Mycobacteriales bacterium]